MIRDSLGVIHRGWRRLRVDLERRARSTIGSPLRGHGTLNGGRRRTTLGHRSAETRGTLRSTKSRSGRHSAHLRHGGRWGHPAARSGWSRRRRIEVHGWDRRRGRDCASCRGLRRRKREECGCRGVVCDFVFIVVVGQGHHRQHAGLIGGPVANLATRLARWRLGWRKGRSPTCTPAYRRTFGLSATTVWRISSHVDTTSILGRKGGRRIPRRRRWWGGPPTRRRRRRWP